MRATGEEVKSRGQAPSEVVPEHLGPPPDLSCLRTVSHQYFWYHTTLSASGHIEEGVDALVLHLTLGIFAAWFLLFLTMITGLKISMQVSHHPYPPTGPATIRPDTIPLLPADPSSLIPKTLPHSQRTGSAIQGSPRQQRQPLLSQRTAPVPPTAGRSAWYPLFPMPHPQVTAVETF